MLDDTGVLSGVYHRDSKNGRRGRPRTFPDLFITADGKRRCQVWNAGLELFVFKLLTSWLERFQSLKVYFRDHEIVSTKYL